MEFSDPLPVNEVFETIQGEGSHTGRPAMFIRLQGCDVGCPWCDTKHTWVIDPSVQIDAGAVVTKGHSEPTWSLVEVEALVAYAKKHKSQLVVITGGEPAMHDLLPLTRELYEAGKLVQIETSGTYTINCDHHTWVTLSPKIDMPGERVVLDEALARADEIKMPVGKPDDIVKLMDLLDRRQHDPAIPIYLQPISLSRKATDLCALNAIANGWRVSIQVHALAGWR